ncbi:MAG: matrixin family metalloprotease, partial [Bacteroidetes bacterium]|nr:matrixin family metalloprotease [Bacteroidota bacterium]
MISRITLCAIVTIAYLQSVRGQVFYDNGAIKSSQKPPSNAFQIQGNRWSKTCITYMFINGTDDIVGNDERGGVIQALQLWQAQTGLVFTEVFIETNADIRIRWATFDHGDPCESSPKNS